MLQKLSDRIQGWFAGVIIVLIAVAFVFWGLEYYMQRGQSDATRVATVNGQPITQTELNQQYQRILHQPQFANQTLSPQQQQEVKALVLQRLVEQTALITQAMQSGYAVSQKQIIGAVQNVPQFQQGGRFSPQRFRQALFEMDTNQQKFFHTLGNQLILSQLEAGIATSAFALPKEVTYLKGLLSQTRDGDYLVVPKAKYLKPDQITEQDIKTYYQGHTKSFMNPLSVQAHYLLLSPNALKKNVTVTDAQAKAYYEKYVGNFTQPETWQIIRLLVAVPKDATKEQVQFAKSQIDNLSRQIKQGQSIETLMKQPIQGLTGKKVTLTSNTVGPELQSQLKALREGTVSAAFRTPEGFNIVKLITMTPKQVKSFDDVSAEIRQRLIQQQVAQQLTTLTQKLSDLVYTHPTSLTEAAKALNLTVQTSPWLTRQGEKTGVFSQKAVLTALFSHDVMQGGNNSDPISLPDGSVITVRVAKQRPESQKPLSEVAVKIKTQLAEERAAREAGLVAYQIRQALRNGQTPAAIAAAHQLTWKTMTNVKRADSELPADVVKTLFSLPRPVSVIKSDSATTAAAKDAQSSSTPKDTTPKDSKSAVKDAKNDLASKDSGAVKGNTLVQPSIQTVELDNGDYAVVRLTNINKATSAPTAKQEAAITHSVRLQLRELLGRNDFESYRTSVIQSSKIKFEPKKSS